MVPTAALSVTERQYLGPKTGTIHNHAQLGLTDKEQSKNWLSVDV